jgi:ATP-dependent DNA helicase RecQ
VYQCVVEYLQIPISAEPYQYYPFELHDFCKKFSLNAVEASYALKILEQEELWTISESVFNPPTLLCAVSRAQIDEFISTYPQYAYFITAILRLYGSLFLYPTAIRLGAVAKQAKLKKDEAESLLHQLHRIGIFEYHAQAEGPQLFFHHYRVDSRQLIINFKRINALKQRHKERTDAMISYLKNMGTCRTKILLAYFDEHKDVDCGHCDICLSNIISASITPGQILTSLRSGARVSIQQLVAQFPKEHKDSVVNLVRKLADDKVVVIDAYGYIMLPTA